MKHHRFHVFVWHLVKPVILPWLRHKFNYRAERCHVEGPYLVLANHNTDWDPLLLYCAFPQQMYFVASEHIFRWGFLAKIIRFLVDPIARMKGTTAGDTALTIMRRLRAGANVALFAEGNRSFNGVTGEILASTGKMARACGATLITYRLDGGYFTSPRWAGSKLRRGEMRGKVMGIYTKEQLKSMSPGEINAIINRDLFVDAYADQRRDMILYKGKNLAEHLETVLCLCPKCGGLGTLKSEGDTFSCTCGLSLTFTPYGFFEGDDVPYDNVTDWDKWQTEQLTARISEEGLIFEDSDIRISEVGNNHTDTLLGTGTLSLYADRLICCQREFPLHSISGISMQGAQKLHFTSGEAHYELSSAQVRCLRKYMTVIEHLARQPL